MAVTGKWGNQAGQCFFYLLCTQGVGGGSQIQLTATARFDKVNILPTEVYRVVNENYSPPHLCC